jgi:hypothetical protein
MCAFDSNSEQSDRDMEKALDNFADKGWKRKKAMLKAAAESRTSQNQDGHQAKAAKDGSPSPAAGTSAKMPAAHVSTEQKPAWVVNLYVTKKGRKGVILRVGPLSAFLPEGDAARRTAVIHAINVIRSDAAYEMVTRITSE